MLHDSLKLLAEYNAAYANGRPIVSDDVYDELWKQVREADPSNPLLYHTSQLTGSSVNMLRHPRPLLGLDKIMSDPKKLEHFLHRFANSPLKITPKLDGIGAVLYNNPDGQRFGLIGDGVEGTDFTKVLPFIGTGISNRAVNRGEIIIPNDKWNPDLGKHPRSTVCGWFSPNAKEVPAQAYQHARFVPFHSLPYTEYDPGKLQSFTLAEVQQQLLNLYMEWSVIYPCDGLVITATSPVLQKLAGATIHFPNWAIAWKPPIITAETIVTKVSWTTARTGRVVPKAHFNPVELCGTTNTKATAHNSGFVKFNHLGQGSHVLIGKAGEIIPQVVTVKSPGNMNVPLICPVCQGQLESDGMNLWCRSQDCVGQLHKKLLHFYGTNGVNVIGLGPSFFAKVLDKSAPMAALLKKKPWLLLLLSNNAADPNWPVYCWLADHFYNQLGQLKLFNTKMKAKGIPATTLLTALGLPAVGKSVAHALLYALYHKKPYPYTRVSTNAINGFSLGAAAYMDMVRDITDLGIEVHKPIADVTKTFSLSGEFTLSRTKIIELLTAAGWTYHPTPRVGTKAFFLGTLPTGLVSAKWTMAQALNIPISTEEDLFDCFPTEENT